MGSPVDPHPIPPPRIPVDDDARQVAIMLLGNRSNGHDFRPAKRNELIELVGAYPDPDLAARWKAWLKSNATQPAIDPPTPPASAPPMPPPATERLPVDVARERALALLMARSTGHDLRAGKRAELLALVGEYPSPEDAARWRFAILANEITVPRAPRAAATAAPPAPPPAAPSSPTPRAAPPAAPPPPRAAAAPPAACSAPIRTAPAPALPLPPGIIPAGRGARDRAIELLDELLTAPRRSPELLDELSALVGRWPQPHIAARWRAWLELRWPSWMAERAHNLPACARHHADAPR